MRRSRRSLASIAAASAANTGGPAPWPPTTIKIAASPVVRIGRGIIPVAPAGINCQTPFLVRAFARLLRWQNPVLWLHAQSFASHTAFDVRATDLVRTSHSSAWEALPRVAFANRYNRCGGQIPAPLGERMPPGLSPDVKAEPKTAPIKAPGSSPTPCCRAYVHPTCTAPRRQRSPRSPAE